MNFVKNKYFVGTVPFKIFMLNQMISDIYREKNVIGIVALQNPINNNSAKIQLPIIIVNKFCFNSQE